MNNTNITTISPHDDADDDHYPRALRRLEIQPILTTSGSLDMPKERRFVAIVGSREPIFEARALAHRLAYHLAKQGIVIVSGGAKGIDTAAHQGAMRARGGSTWAVVCSGHGVVYPKENAELFDAIAAPSSSGSSSRMIWPFDAGTPVTKTTPRFRNGVLVGLSEVVVVVQAGFKSGSRNAASWARTLGKRLFIVPAAPWDTEHFGGSLMEAVGHYEEDRDTLFVSDNVPKRVRPEIFWSLDQFFFDLGLPKPDLDDPGAEIGAKPPLKAPVRRKRHPILTFDRQPFKEGFGAPWSADEKAVFSRLSMAPQQQDEIIGKTGLGAGRVLSALLTLSLKDVVVEGPDGCFRRRVTP